MAAVPRLTVRAYARLLGLPAAETMRVLEEQKNPSAEPQKFRVPYYQPFMASVRRYYRSRNDPTVLRDAMAKAQGLVPEHKADNNLRAIEQFAASAEAKRQLYVIPLLTFDHVLRGIKIRLRFDLQAIDGDLRKFILYNTKTAAIDLETARATLDIAHWVLERAGERVPMGQVEFVDVPTGTRHAFTRRRASTIKKVESNARLIKALWPTL